MKAFRTIVLGCTLTTAAGYLAYRTLLKDDARRRVDEAVEMMKESYMRLNEIVENMTGIVMEETETTLPNRKETMGQWESLGYSK